MLPFSIYKSDSDKPREQLISELTELRSRISEQSLELSRLKKTKAPNSGSICQTNTPHNIEHYCRELSDTAPVMLWVTNSDGTCIYLNKSWYEFTGQSAATGLGSRWADAIHPDDRNYVLQSFSLANKKTKQFRLEYRLRRTDGKLRWVIDSGKPRWGADGEFLGYTGSVIDITEKKQAENSLAHKHELLQKIFDNIPVLLVMWEPQLQRFTLNRHAEFVLGWTTEDANRGDFLSMVYPDREYRADVCASMQSLEPGWREWICTTKTGEMVTSDWANVHLSDDTMVGIGMDLRERKNSEEKLRESERKFRTMIDALPLAVYTTDPEGRITNYNPAAVDLSGHVPEIGKNSWCVTWKLYNPDGKPTPIDEFPMAMAIKKGRAVRNIEAIAERPDGTRRWIEPYPTPIYDSNGNLIGGINVLVDITERKRVDAILQENMQRYRVLFEQSADGIYLHDLDGKIIDVNRAGVIQSGYSKKELRSMLVFDFITGEYNRQDILRLWREWEPERPFIFETMHQCKDGTVYNAEVNAAKVRFGSEDFILAIVRDITERKQAKEALLRLNETLEQQVAQRTGELERRNMEIRELAHMTINAMENDRKALSKELHDGIGGTLAAIKYQLESRMENVGPPPPSIELPLEKIITYLSDAIKESRRITKQLRPSVLDDFGLVAAIKEHISDFQEFHPKIKVLKRISINEDELSNDAKTVLYRVLQEALNNVGKHSNADHIDIQCFRYDGWIKLKIQDNGIGFNAGGIMQSPNAMEGYGLYGMKERVEICKGEFHIESAPGKGTTIIASIPFNLV